MDPELATVVSLPPKVTCEDWVVPGPLGSPDVTVRIYRPNESGEPWPAMLWINGGGIDGDGCAGGDAGATHPNAAWICAEAKVIVVSPEYRLAPENPFPAGLEDCYATLRWLVEHAEVLGVDRGRVAVGGASAGGGLAAGLALLARDRGGPSLCYQLLAAPELDDRLATPSMIDFADTPLWSRPNAVRSWQRYLGRSDDATPGGAKPGDVTLGDAAFGDDVSPYAAPARATDLVGLPPAYVSAAEFDPLRDEGIDYALALLRAGVSVELHQFPGTFHGASLERSAAVFKRQAREIHDVLRRALYPAPQPAQI